jgi:hypothetical protein
MSASPADTAKPMQSHENGYATALTRRVDILHFNAKPILCC